MARVEHITEWDMRGMDDTDLWFSGTGWYFTDETGEFNGPYTTLDDATKAEERYNGTL